MIENRFGLNSLTIELVNEQPPDIPLDFRLVYANYTQLTLAWSKNFDGGYEQAFELEVNQTHQLYKNLTQTVHNLTNLELNKTYSIRLRASNQIGSSGWTSFLIVNTLDVTNVSDMPKLSNLTFHLNDNMDILLMKFKLTNLIIGNVGLCAIAKMFDNKYNYVNISNCVPIEANQTILKLNDLVLSSPHFIPNLKVAICLQSNQQICGEEVTAIYGT